MTKTAKTTSTANNHHASGNQSKKPLKCSKVKKKIIISKEQEAAIAETISLVIRNKLTKRLDHAVPRKKSAESINKATKPAKKQSKDCTAKKTAPKAASPTRAAKSPKKEVSASSNETPTVKTNQKKVAVKRVNKSPVAKLSRQDNKGEIKENKAETKSESKQISTKVNSEKEKKVDGVEKIPSGGTKDKKDKEMSDVERKDGVDKQKDKKDTEKLIKEKKSDCVIDKLSKDKEKTKEVSEKGKKQITNVKDKPTKKPLKDVAKKKVLLAVNQKKLKNPKAKEKIKKAIAVKVKKVNLKKLNKPAAKKTKKIIEPNKDKELKDNVKDKVMDKEIKEPKEVKAKASLQLKIKEELLDEVLENSDNQDSGRDTPEKGASPKKLQPKNKKDQESKKETKTDLKKKLKAQLQASTLKTSTVVVKKQNQKPKLVTKPIQQVKSRKLVSMWNGPKRHRVASLNAIAKVHCLYENEYRANFDQSDAPVKSEPSDRDKNKSDDKKYRKSSRNDRDTPSPQPTRTLRSVPGLRAVGKLWDMHDTTSSSEEYSDIEEEDERVEEKKVAKTKKPSKPAEKRAAPVHKPRKPVVKRRKKEETVMDLKDMVVRKRMASLNASAILAASYSVEKRVRNPNGDSDYDDSETTSDSEEEEESEDGSESEQLRKLDLDIKKEVKEEKIDRKMIEVRAGSNKKVAVILNQDTDVTFTGVYVNSTTRSTHHEGYCQIAGMQYRISATSHTQTAATAVATETILQSTTTTTHENENADASPVKSYTPLDALSNMQPPANSTSTLQPHHHLPPPPPPPPQHVMPPHGPSAAEMSSLTRRHGCTSAFSAPPPGCGPQGHHHLPPEHHGYVSGYYQPAGPLISVHGHSQAPPPPTLSGKVVPLPDASPASTSPLHQPPPPSSAGDSSDSEVVITSVTTAKEALASQPPTTYRLNHHYPPPHSSYPTYGGPYPPHYYTAPPPPPGPPYSHHEMCYTPFPPTHKYMFRGYLAPRAPPYYQPGSPDIYGQPPNSANQQVVAATSSASGSYQSSSTGPPPPTLMEPYPGPPPTLIETYPPPAHYYQGYSPAPPCYTHSPPARPLNYINATYQACPCPMQSCSKNVHTGPLAGDSKRSNISIAKESMPLPPVALALPLEPASATGPPSPARGSAGMPPPPSPAGATYQQPPPKQETPEPAAEVHHQVEKRRKARVGKAMVRNTIAQNQNTMLLMCQTQSQNTILSSVKREVESPQDDVTDVKKNSGQIVQQVPATPCVVVELTDKNVVLQKKEPEEHEKGIKCETPETPPSEKSKESENEEKEIESTPSPQPPPSISPPEAAAAPSSPSPKVVTCPQPSPTPTTQGVTPVPQVDDELLLPCQKTVAENVKVKNMKRKLSCSGKEQPAVVKPEPLAKKQKLEKPNGSYKDLIKKTQNVVKINNGKRKLISETVNVIGLRFKKNNKRRLNGAAAAAVANKEENARRLKSTKPLTDSNVLTSTSKLSVKDCKTIVDPELIENKEPTKKALKKQLVHNKNTSKKALVHNGTTVQPSSTTSIPPSSSPATATCDNNSKVLNNVDRTIESVVNNARASKQVPENGALRTENGRIDAEPKKAACTTAKKSTNKATKVKKSADLGGKAAPTASTIATPAVAPVRRSKSKEVPQVITKVPRRSVQLRWSNGWRWHGDAFDGKVFLNSDEATVMRKCYPAMVHEEGDIIEPRDCVLLKAGQRKNELPFVAKIAALWENPDDGEMMMSLLWYYRPEHTEQGRRPVDQPDEVFASRHKDSNSVACIEDKCYVLTYNEYCRYRKDLRRLESGIEDTGPCIPLPDVYPRQHRQPPSTMGTSADLVFFCRKVYDFRQKRIIKNPS